MKSIEFVQCVFLPLEILESNLMKQLIYFGLKVLKVYSVLGRIEVYETHRNEDVAHGSHVVRRDVGTAGELCLVGTDGIGK